MKLYYDMNSGFIWTLKEIKQEYDLSYEIHEQFSDFEEYMDYLLSLGRERSTGLKEISVEDVIVNSSGLYKIKEIKNETISIAQYLIPEDNYDEDDNLDDAWLGNTYDITVEELANAFVIYD